MRASSPPSGFSILITSAPMSASNTPASGPARAWPTSMTRIPSSGSVTGASLQSEETRSLSFGRPGKIHVPVASVVADVAIHLEVLGPARRVGIDRCRIGKVGLVLREVVERQCGGKDVHCLRDAPAVEPVGGMLSHGIAEHRRSQADA